MKVGVIVLTISFILDGLLSTFLPFELNNLMLLKTMFTIVSIVLIYPYFNNDKSQFYRVVVTFGFIYDIVYTNSFPLNTFLFFLLAVTAIFLNSILSNNNLNIIIMTVVVILIYELLNFTILNIIDYTNISFKDMLYKVSNSLILNIAYNLFFSICLNYISDKYNIKRIN